MGEMYTKKKDNNIDHTLENLSRWNRCFLTKEKLDKRIVCDKLGNLYNKEAVIKLLMNQYIPDTLKHVSRKTITDINTSKDKMSNLRSKKLICQISEKKMDGSFRTIVSTSTGYVFSRKIARQFPQISEEIIGKKISEEEWINLCPPIAESKVLNTKLSKKIPTQKITSANASIKNKSSRKNIEKMSYIYKIPKEYGETTSRLINKGINLSPATYDSTLFSFPLH